MLFCDNLNEAINITDAFYGRTSKDVCQVGDYTSNLKCVDANVMKKVSHCNGSGSCIIDMSVWKDEPCPGVEKYLNVIYRCEPSS